MPKETTPLIRRSFFRQIARYVFALLIAIQIKCYTVTNAILASISLAMDSKKYQKKTSTTVIVAD